MMTKEIEGRSSEETGIDSTSRRSLALHGGLIGALNVVAWVILLVSVAPQYPKMLALGVLAFTFGLRHAFDADHISAIDNTVRKLLQVNQRRKPIGVGFYFSMGHSTVVALLALGLAIAASQVRSELPVLQSIGSVLSTLLSGAFLYVIGLLNLAVLLGIVVLFKRMRGGTWEEAEVERQLQHGGLMTRLLGSRWEVVRHDWQMYPVGFLFGLGFDTASEVALLAISATAAAQRLPIVVVMALPLMFAAGMSVMDTLDGAFMSTAYTWAFSDPLRKVYYNLTVTGLSVFVALGVGTIEFAQVLAGQLKLRSPFWSALQNLSFSSLGYGIVIVFVLTWLVSYLLWIWRVEHRWRNPLAGA
jgi:high-affinity nickel-transport protein